MSDTDRRELDERIMREGTPNITYISFTVTKDGDEYTIGEVMAERHGHELGDEYLWHSDTKSIFTSAAKIRGCTINVKYKHTTYVLDGDYFSTISDVDIEEIKND